MAKAYTFGAISMDVLEAADSGGLAEGSRREQVLELVARRRSLKQVASELGISESTVNYHIRALKEQHRVNTLAQLADVYASAIHSGHHSPDRFSASSESTMFFGNKKTAASEQDECEPLIRFQDAISYGIDAPWVVNSEPAVVPEVLEGTNAGLLRGAVIVAIALGVLALVLLGLGVAQGITAALSASASSAPGT